MAPDIRDMKALATALKLAGAFETVDRLAHDWIERGMREKKPEELEEDEKREWYDLSDSWERAIDALKKKVSNFQKETGYSPILRYWRQADSMGETGKIYLGYDSAQAKGYRIIEITFPVWFEELNLPTEEKSEEDVYRLVPVERLSDEQERTLRDSFVEDLKEAGIEPLVTRVYIDRYESTIDRRRTYNENVFRVESLVEAIKRERALAVVKPTPIAVVAPPIVARTVYTLEQMWEAWGPQNRKTMLLSAGYPYVDIDITVKKEWNNLEDAERKAIEKAWRTLEEKEKAAAQIPSEVKVKLHVEEGMSLGEYFAHLLYDSFEVTFVGILSTQALKDYLEEKEDYIDFREQLSFQGYGEPQLEEELKKFPWPFSSGEEIKVVWTAQDVEFTSTAKEWWDAFNKTYTRNELEAFDVERLKTIARLKGVKVGKDKAETVAYILGEAPSKVKGYDELKREFEGKDLVDALAMFISNYYGYRRDYLLEDLNRFLTEFKAKLSDEDVRRFYKVYPNLRQSFVSIAGLAGWVPPSPLPVAPAAKPPAVARPLTTAEISKLQDVYSDALFRQLGRVPPNALATFRVEIDKVKDKSYAEAQDHILGVANDIVGAFVAKEGLGRITPAHRFEVSPPERPEEGAPMGRVPPAQFPSYPLCYNLPFPRGPCSEEKIKLWNVFCYQMQESGYDCMAYQRQFDDYIEGTQFLSWEDLRAKFKIFVETIMKGLGLPPLFTWRGAPIPTGLRGEIQERLPLEKLEDLVTHFSSVVIRNARSKGDVPTLEDLKDELVEHGIIPATTSILELRDVAKTALTHALERNDTWVSGISTTEINDFLASD